MEGLRRPRTPLDAFAADHPDVTLDLRAWVQDGRGGTWLHASTERELLAKLVDALDGQW